MNWLSTHLQRRVVMTRLRRRRASRDRPAPASRGTCQCDDHLSAMHGGSCRARTTHDDISSERTPSSAECRLANTDVRQHRAAAAAECMPAASPILVGFIRVCPTHSPLEGCGPLTATGGQLPITSPACRQALWNAQATFPIESNHVYTL